MPYGQVLVDTVKDSLNNVLAPASAVFRNRIINGAMVIDQRNAGASASNAASAVTYTVDRFAYYASQASKFTFQQNAGSVTPPVGFSKYLGITSSSAYTVGSGELFTLYQPIEGFNTADLGWGTANAKTVTLSFWVYSSLTGTFGGSLQNSANDRSYPYSYSIPVANTWTQISVTIAGDTTGTWIGATNGVGLIVRFSLGAGSTYSGTAGSWAGANYVSATGATSVVGTNGATLYITGVQLEVGTNATGYEYRQYTTELQLCQRYYENNYNAGTAVGTSFGSQTALFQQTICTTNGQLTGSIPFKVSKRTSPTITFYNRDGTINQWLQGKQGQTESTYTPAAVTNNQYMFGWSNSGINTDSNVHYGMFTASAEL